MNSMTTLGLFFSVFLGVVATTIFGVPAFLISLYLNKKNYKKYLYDVAIGIDELGGTLIYSTKDKTVSHMTGYYVLQGSILAIMLSKFIDSLFGEDHCVKTYMDDIKNEMECKTVDE